MYCMYRDEFAIRNHLGCPFASLLCPFAVSFYIENYCKATQSPPRVLESTESTESRG